ncbi:AraC family transcriptional regulator [Flavobacterium sp. UMI-01]|uniref:helix-turn-helix domain-containing protein n=1 Tax=Flavobacterium sp. UMI-01 TaxID=1441053 RepID=UPI001C7DF14F|nr:helix-turn-helix domain-containing protein [Flavobacterium sp. UMI-01]GIZ07757.1 hypothetical protein FUMI01_04840 [Flavobacterium sp. UMI-01]
MLFIGIVISIFLSIILISKTKKTQADWILVVWLIAVAINLFLYSFQEKGTIFQNPLIMGWIFPMPLLYWPFLYLYVRALTFKQKLQLIHLIHFAPFVLSVSMFSTFYILPSFTKIEIFKRNGVGYEFEMNINLLAIYISAFIYTVLSLNRLKEYSILLKNEFSSIEKINLYWLRYLILGMTIIFFVVIFGNDALIYYSVTVFIIFIGYFGIKQVGIFSQNNFQIEDSTPDIIKYEKSTLVEQVALKIQKEMNLLMTHEKLFKDAEINLEQLAEKLNVSSNHLSQVINSLENKTFYEYINHLRVEEFCSLIENGDNKKLTLLAIALDCGFNSKSTFNRNFKMMKGITPSEYLKQLQEGKYSF